MRSFIFGDPGEVPVICIAEAFKARVDRWIEEHSN